MKNLMAKSMVERYVKYFSTSRLEEKGGQIIYWWVMSTLESFFWGLRLTAHFTADLYASEKEMFLVIRDSTGEEHEFVHYPTYNTSNGNLCTMLKIFIENFNSIEWPLSENIPSPVFHAGMLSKWEHPYNRKKYKGYYNITISINMLPDGDDDPANHGKYA